jgi:D-glycero-alpha-D-manno-heptose-7-phosphate kinase
MQIEPLRGHVPARIYLATQPPDSSSAVHGEVIRRLEQPNADHSALAELRKAAHDGKSALYAGDLDAFGQAVIANTKAQAELHPALVSAQAREVIRIARRHGAVGWKVNGAGGEGGSLTILCGASGDKKRAFVNAVHSAVAGCRVIPTYLARTGLRRWETVG